ncbi:MAG: DnaJ domain-containing protein [Caldilineaceae bacterium]|nr:DnaJ domain-containing protein [Caldilineaceae bacterium]HRJ42080.1 DnaJ C-terminal domain-containing protein [Caldilineaceae bacterium]
MEVKDYYRTLGVARNADEKEIKKAFRKLARENHPDLNPNDAEAERRFKEANEAYEVLSDADKRRKYDQFGAQWEQYERAGVNPNDFARGFGGGSRNIPPEEFERIFGGFGRPGSGGAGGFSDFFETLFGAQSGMRSGQSTPFGGFNQRPQRPRQSEVEADVSLEEAFHGTTRMIQLADGQRIEVSIPAGIQSGTRVRAGDVLLRVKVQPHARFRLDGNDLHVTVPVDLYTALLGGEVEIPTLERPVVLTIPGGSQNGKRFRLRGLGMPAMKKSDKAGDIYAEISITLPTSLSPKERQLVEELRGLQQKEK